jgi:hypothetical protein
VVLYTDYFDMLFSWNKHLRDLHGHAFACTLLPSNVSSERTHSDPCNLFFNKELLFKFFSRVNILLWKKMNKRKPTAKFLVTLFIDILPYIGCLG